MVRRTKIAIAALPSSTSRRTRTAAATTIARARPARREEEEEQASSFVGDTAVMDKVSSSRGSIATSEDDGDGGVEWVEDEDDEEFGDDDGAEWEWEEGRGFSSGEMSADEMGDMLARAGEMSPAQRARIWMTCLTVGLGCLYKLNAVDP
jgi:hypothetical protein